MYQDNCPVIMNDKQSIKESVNVIVQIRLTPPTRYVILSAIESGLFFYTYTTCASLATHNTFVRVSSTATTQTRNWCMKDERYIHMTILDHFLISSEDDFSTIL